jgi:hypothetical protein
VEQGAHTTLYAILFFTQGPAACCKYTEGAQQRPNCGTCWTVVAAAVACCCCCLLLLPAAAHPSRLLTRVIVSCSMLRLTGSAQASVACLLLLLPVVAAARTAEAGMASLTCRSAAVLRLLVVAVEAPATSPATATSVAAVAVAGRFLVRVERCACAAYRRWLLADSAHVSAGAACCSSWLGREGRRCPRSILLSLLWRANGARGSARRW